ncbi:MAG: arginine N-succinyltransferase [Pseudomonadota bacterium]
MPIPVIRPAVAADLDAFAEFGALTGGGMTNLPNDRDALAERLARSEAAFQADIAAPEDELYIFALDLDGRVRGCVMLFSRVGTSYGFVNFKRTTLVHASPPIRKRVDCELLVLNHDFTGAAEVGGLFLHPDERGGGLGRFLARSRYLFIAQSPERFDDRVLAELRGWRAPDGRQPFWEAVGRRFFDMEFEEADLMNARMGNRFISDLMPQHPVYVAMLPDDARACIGRTHETGRAAYRMLIDEGFRDEGYIDIFDGGPLVAARQHEIHAICDSRIATVVEGDAEAGDPHFIAAGAAVDFRCGRGPAAPQTDGTVCLAAALAERLAVKPGDAVRVL